MLGILTGFEPDSHRQTLDYFHVVTGRILRRQKAETVAAGAGQVLHVAAIIAAEGIDVNRDVLAAAHFRELGLFEVRGHPDVLGLNHGH